MIYEFQLYDVTNTTREAILDNVLYAQESAVLAGEHTMSLEVSPYAVNGDQVLGVDASDAVTLPLLQEGKYIRLHPESGSAVYFRISSIETKHVKGKYLFRVTCEHIKYAARDKVIPLIEDYVEISATELLSNCMAYVTGFTIGTNDIPTDEYRDVSIKQINLLELLNVICTKYSGTTKYYFTVSSAKVINILSDTNIGSEKNFALIYDGNTDSVLRRSDSSTLVNKLYAHSPDGNRLEYADGQKYCDETLGTVLTVGLTEIRTLSGNGSDANCVTSGSTLSFEITVGLYFSSPIAGYGNMDFDVELLDSAGATVWGSTTFTSVDITAGAGWQSRTQWINIDIGNSTEVKKIKLTCGSSSAFDGAILSACICRLDTVWYELGPNIAYIDDSVSDGKYGTYAHPVELDFPSVKNIHREYYQVDTSVTENCDSTMSGKYYAGVHEGWEDVSVGTSVTVSEDTDRDYIKNGTKSMKVTCPTKSNARIQTDRYIPGLVKDKSYYAIWNLYISYGTLQITIEDEDGNVLFDHTTSGVGWIEVKNDDPFSSTDNSGFRLKIVSTSKTSEFYLDSVQVAQGTAVMPFVKAVNADNMKTEAERLLENNKNPIFTYEINHTDLSSIDPQTLDESYNVGDQILVIDPDVYLNNYLRVVKITRNLLDSRNNRLELSNRTTPLSNIISLLTGQKQLLIT